MKAHQRKIRDKWAWIEPRSPVPLSECSVVEINREQAAPIIMKYEWLATMNNVFMLGYGLVDSNDELLGVVCFGTGGGTRSALSICGAEYAKKAICLERGACVHYAHEHAASHLISTACKMAHRDYGYSIFYAYSDAAAGEIGTVYQACNWTFIGTGRKAGQWRWEYIAPDGKVVNSRIMRKRIRKSYGEHSAPLREYWPELESIGWTRRRAYDRARYVWFEGSKTAKRNLKKLLKYPSLPYPKRTIET